MKAAFHWERHEIIAKKIPFCFIFFVFCLVQNDFFLKPKTNFKNLQPGTIGIACHRLFT